MFSALVGLEVKMNHRMKGVKDLIAQGYIVDDPEREYIVVESYPSNNGSNLAFVADDGRIWHIHSINVLVDKDKALAWINKIHAIEEMKPALPKPVVQKQVKKNA